MLPAFVRVLKAQCAPHLMGSVASQWERKGGREELAWVNGGGGGAGLGKEGLEVLFLPLLPQREACHSSILSLLARAKEEALAEVTEGRRPYRESALDSFSRRCPSVGQQSREGERA